MGKLMVRERNRAFLVFHLLRTVHAKAPEAGVTDRASHKSASLFCQPRALESRFSDHEITFSLLPLCCYGYRFVRSA
jgi:hypothetical protein